MQSIIIYSINFLSTHFQSHYLISTYTRVSPNSTGCDSKPGEELPLPWFDHLLPFENLLKNTVRCQAHWQGTEEVQNAEKVKLICERPNRPYELIYQSCSWFYSIGSATFLPRSHTAGLPGWLPGLLQCQQRIWCNWCIGQRVCIGSTLYTSGADWPLQ